MFRTLDTFNRFVLGCALVLIATVRPEHAAAANSYGVLWALGRAPDGAYPIGGVISDAPGNLYSTTYYGGANNNGAIFELAPDGTENRPLLLLQAGCPDDSTPFAGVTRDKAGNLYGTTMDGGRRRR